MLELCWIDCIALERNYVDEQSQILTHTNRVRISYHADFSADVF